MPQAKTQAQAAPDVNTDAVFVSTPLNPARPTTHHAPPRPTLRAPSRPTSALPEDEAAATPTATTTTTSMPRQEFRPVNMPLSAEASRQAREREWGQADRPSSKREEASRGAPTHLVAHERRYAVAVLDGLRDRDAELARRVRRRIVCVRRPRRHRAAATAATRQVLQLLLDGGGRQEEGVVPLVVLHHALVRRRRRTRLAWCCGSGGAAAGCRGGTDLGWSGVFDLF